MVQRSNAAPEEFDTGKPDHFALLLPPVGRLLCVWQALLYIRDARQEDRLVLVPGISAENIFVPVVRGRAVLHDVGARVQLSSESSRPHASDFSIEVAREHWFGDAHKNVRRVKDDMVIK
jgi:hypothetical protein